MKRAALFAAAFTLAAAALAQAQGEGRPGIAWQATWDAARAEAERTGKPIMLVSAAPQCHNVSGIW